MADQVDLGIEGLSDYRQMGAGGFATVFSANEADAGRRVAVKVLTTVDEDGLRRFDRERRSMGRTTPHPHIVTMFRSGYTPDRRPYLVLEHLDGGSLQDVLDREGPMPWARAVGLLVPIADALRFSHANGILHRDVKPSNILLTSTGTAKLTDFGIAAVREATATAHLAFSIAYTSPETFELERDAAGQSVDTRDERSDLYSLAATLYALGTGRPPYSGASAAVLMRQVLDDPVPTTGRADIDGFLRSAMAKDPDDRPATAQEVIERLTDLLDRLGPIDVAPTDRSIAGVATRGPADGSHGSPRPIGAGDATPTVVDPALAAEPGSTGTGPGPSTGGPTAGQPGRGLDRRAFLGAAGVLGIAGAGGLVVALANRGGDRGQESVAGDDRSSSAGDRSGAAAEDREVATTTTAEPRSEEPPGTDVDELVAEAAGVVALTSLYLDLDDARAALDEAVTLMAKPDLTVGITHGPWGSTDQLLEAIRSSDGTDIHGWSGGSRSLDRNGQIAEVSDLWDGGLTAELGEALRGLASSDGDRQYFVPWDYYLWAVYYRRSVFRDRGYVAPSTWDDLLALAERMTADGITPFAFGNDVAWPAMGIFDQLDLRLNGTRFHLDLLAGRESWLDDRVRSVFDHFAQLLVHHQPGANGRSWPEAANGLVDGSAGMYIIGTFVRDAFPAVEADDLDFFVFPELVAAHGASAVEAPMDGWVLLADSADADAARSVLYQLGTAPVQERFFRRNPASVMAHPGVDRSLYDPLLAKVASVVSGAGSVTQFLDRDTDPRFAAEVVGPALAAFVDAPSGVEQILAELEDQAEVYLRS